MIRPALVVLVFAMCIAVLGVPLLAAGLVYPSRRLFAWVSTAWARLMLLSCGVRLTVEGTEVIRPGKPMFFVGNHQSALDIPILIILLRGHVRFMAKDSLFRIPIFGWIMSRYGNVPIVRHKPRLARRELERMVESLERRPISFVAFPEGTRSPDGRLLPFRKGTMKICQRAGLPIVPFALDGSADVYRRKELRVRAGPVHLRLAAPIPFEEATSMSVQALHDRVRSCVAEELAVIRRVSGVSSGPNAR